MYSFSALNKSSAVLWSPWFLRRHQLSVSVRTASLRWVTSHWLLLGIWLWFSATWCNVSQWDSWGSLQPLDVQLDVSDATSHVCTINWFCLLSPAPGANTGVSGAYLPSSGHCLFSFILSIFPDWKISADTCLCLLNLSSVCSCKCWLYLKVFPFQLLYFNLRMPFGPLTNPISVLIFSMYAISTSWLCVVLWAHLKLSWTLCRVQSLGFLVGCVHYACPVFVEESVLCFIAWLIIFIE